MGYAEFCKRGTDEWSPVDDRVMSTLTLGARLSGLNAWDKDVRRYGNSVAPLLISEQGNNKSTFCRRLLPDSLQWGYNDNLLVSEKKQTLMAMSQFLLINLDEFNQISPKLQEGFLKNVIQLASVKVKRPYGRHVEEFPRLASFIATTNETYLWCAAPRTGGHVPRQPHQLRPRAHQHGGSAPEAIKIGQALSGAPPTAVAGRTPSPFTRIRHHVPV